MMGADSTDTTQAVFTGYLQDEYGLCYEQLRFYDSRNGDLLKYITSLITAVTAAQWAVYELLNEASKSFYYFLAFTSLVVSVGAALLIVAMLQNRVYFIRMARQLNAIRNFAIETDAQAFQEKNRLWTSTSMPASNKTSLHGYQIRGSILISAFFAGEVLFALLRARSESWLLSMGAGGLLILILYFGGKGWAFDQLKKKGDDTAAKAQGAQDDGASRAPGDSKSHAGGRSGMREDYGVTGALPAAGRRSLRGPDVESEETGGASLIGEEDGEE